MATPLEEVFILLEKIGFTQVILPFILVFTLVYAFLQKTKVLGRTEEGKAKKRLNAMVAFVIGFFVLAAVDILNVINIISQYLVLVIIACLLIAVLLSFLGVKNLEKSNLVKFVGLIIVLTVVLYALGIFDFIDLGSFDRFLITPIVGVVIFLLVLWFLLREKKERKKEKAAEEKKAKHHAPEVLEREKVIEKPRGRIGL